MKMRWKNKKIMKKTIALLLAFVLAGESVSWEGITADATEGQESTTQQEVQMEEGEREDAESQQEETGGEATEIVETTRDYWTPEGLLESAPIMGKGMLGIFIVMGIVIGCVSILNNASGPRKKKEKKQ